MKKLLLLLGLTSLIVASCQDENFQASSNLNATNVKGANSSLVELRAHSNTPNFLDLKPGFKNLQVFPILSSEDVLTGTPDFVYGSMADGAGLIKNDDGTFSLINNIEADFSIARITLDETFKPINGVYIVNAVATGHNAQCSGHLNTIKDHGFSTYFSGGEWNSDTPGVFNVDPNKDPASASSAEKLTAMGQWIVENAVTANKAAFPGKTVVVIGDDQSDNVIPSGQVGMYIGETGDLYNGKLYGLRVPAFGDSSNNIEMSLEEGVSYNLEFIELLERDQIALDAECKAKGVMGFSRVEDLDWRKGSPKNNREFFFAVTGRPRESLIGLGSQYGRVYQVVLNENDPTKGKITCILDGDNFTGKAKAFLSPDNILVTDNYVYIQEDPNVNPADLGAYPDKQHFAQLYEYNIKSKNLKTVLEVDQDKAATMGYGTVDDTWEITGMIDISDIVGIDRTMLLITQNHGWGDSFTDTDALVTESGSPTTTGEGSQLYIVQGLKNH